MSRAAFLLSPWLLLIVTLPSRGEDRQRFVPTAEALASAYDRQRPPLPRVLNQTIEPHWIDNGQAFWYRRDLKGDGHEFVLIESAIGKRAPAFDHRRLAESLAKASGGNAKPERLPFNQFTFTDGRKTVRFRVGDNWWECSLDDYECRKSTTPADDRKPPARGDRSPDLRRTVITRDGNLFVRDKDGSEKQITTDGKGNVRYVMAEWSPDLKTLSAFRLEPGDDKEVFRIESSPKDGGRARLQRNAYPLPGDKLATYTLFLYDPATGMPIKTDAPPVDLDSPRIHWSADGSALTYEKADRGHQRFRLIEVDARTGKSRAIIDESSETFIWTRHFEQRSVPIVTRLNKSNELIHSSERSGWRHLYLVNGATGKVKNAITVGKWVVRGIDRIDEDTRQIWFRASGTIGDQDPYFIHHYRVNFDGGHLLRLTEGNGTHTVQWSPANDYLIDTYSRVDLQPEHILRRADGAKVCEIDVADNSAAVAAGWKAPSVFTAIGRNADDIWGVIYRPTDFDPAKSYPVIESIYAGPHGAFVPKAFSNERRFAHLTDLGFIVVQIDGMGTAHRSKAFHDVCWKNLKDAGFPDRILWHQAAARAYPWYDASRVGIFGTSAGGQNAASAVLFHGDFYKAAVASCGCHDNRMDKASWNEQWMGYPVGPHYAASSNIENAAKLKGKLLLIDGELDTNVPPESTLRFCDALIKARKEFEFLMVPGMGHSDGGPYGRRRLQDFFVRHLHEVAPPDHNARPLPRGK